MSKMNPNLDGLIKTLFFRPMADLILQNNIQWDRALLKQVQYYKQNGTVPWLANKNFSSIALAISLKAGKITFTNKGTVYEIVPSTNLWRVRKEVKVGDCIVYTY